MEKYNIIEKYKNGDKVIYILSSFFVVMIAICVAIVVGITKNDDPVMEVKQVSGEENYDEALYAEKETNDIVTGQNEATGDNCSEGQYNDDSIDDTLNENGMSLIKVYICGQVVKAGVYDLNEGDRVIDAVEKAGGLTADAFAEAVNLSEKLVDESKVYIPSFKEVHIEDGKSILSENNIKFNEGSAIINRSQIHVGENDGKSTGDNKININTANADQLTMITGVGKTRAENIIAFREKNGAFTKIEDITKVTGIGAASFEKMKEQITVE